MTKKNKAERADKVLANFVDVCIVGYLTCFPHVTQEDAEEAMLRLLQEYRRGRHRDEAFWRERAKVCGSDVRPSPKSGGKSDG